MLEALELVEAGAGRGEEHDVALLGIGERRVTAASRVPEIDVRGVAEGGGEVRRRPRRSGRPWRRAGRAGGAPRCRPPSGGRRRSSGCARRRGAPSRRRRRWSPSKSLTMRTPLPGGDELAAVGEAGVAGERGLDLARARGRGCGRRHRRRRRSGGCGRRAASAWAAGRSRRPVARARHSARKPLRAVTCPAGAGELAGDGDRDHRVAGGGLLAHDVGEEAALVLVDADDRPRRAALGEEPALGGEVAARGRRGGRGGRGRG